MNKKQLVVVALCLMALATSALALSSSVRHAVGSIGRGQDTQSGDPLRPRQQAALENGALGPKAQQDQAADSAQAQAQEIPKHVVYGMLFKEIAAFKKKAHELKLKGEDDTHFREYHKRKLSLDEGQSAAFERIADDAARKMSKLDEQAKKVIDGIRAQRPDGRLKEGELPPAPPEELKNLDRQRVDLLLRAREELLAALGEAEFQRLENLLLVNAAQTIRPIHVGDALHKGEK
jgi:hypothetical protein